MERRAFLSLGVFGWFPFHRRFADLAGIRFRVLRNGHSRHRYLLIHGNEETARRVLSVHLEMHSGIAYLVTNRTRNVAINGGELDPNRMYSRVGAEMSLKRLNPQWSEAQVSAALDYLDGHREKLIKHLAPPPGGLLIAVHNNSEGYSVTEEMDQSDATSIREPHRPHEFFLCTDERDYKTLAASPYNVVWQKSKPAEDDGSLSRLAAKRGFRYVNLETELGKFEAQQERLEWMERNLS